MVFWVFCISKTKMVYDFFFHSKLNWSNWTDCSPSWFIVIIIITSCDIYFINIGLFKKVTINYLVFWFLVRFYLLCKYNSTLIAGTESLCVKFLLHPINSHLASTARPFRWMNCCRLLNNSVPSLRRENFSAHF